MSSIASVQSEKDAPSKPIPFKTRFVPPATRRKEFLAFAKNTGSPANFLERDPSLLSDPIIARAMNTVHERQRRAAQAKKSEELADRLRTMMAGTTRL
jgi:hypothetical protein